MKVYIVRHTSVVYDGNVTCYGATDVALRDTFEAEAKETKSKLEGVEVDAVYTSPLSRASRLAAFCGYEDAERDDRLKEMNFGEWELRPWAEIIGEEDTVEFFRKAIDTPAPGGESQREQLERVRDFIEEKKREGKENILVFCHGGVINCARTLAGDCLLEESFAFIPPFGSVTLLEF